MIVKFDYDTHILCPLTNDQEVLKEAIKNAFIPATAGTTLRDAVYQTITRSFAEIKGRKAIIVLTDGKDFGSRISPDSLLYKLQETDTLVYSVFFKTEEMLRVGPFGRGGLFGGGFPGPRNDNRRQRMNQQNKFAEEFLQKLSDMTAGRLYPSSDGKLKKLFANIVEELRFQYRIGFYPPDENGVQSLHELKVRIARPDVVVRARSGYRIQTQAK
jgi:VWFA-related protein